MRGRYLRSAGERTARSCGVTCVGRYASLLRMPAVADEKPDEEEEEEEKGEEVVFMLLAVMRDREGLRSTGCMYEGMRSDDAARVGRFIGRE